MMFFEHAPDILTIPIVTADSRAVVICHHGQGLLMGIGFFVRSPASQCIVAIRQPHNQSLGGNVCL